MVTAASHDAVETAAEVAAVLGTDPLVDPAWDAAGDHLVEAWDGLVSRGGTTVVVCGPDAVRGVIGHVLGVPEGRRARIAVAPGSLAGVEVWGGDDISVAFTNRT